MPPPTGDYNGNGIVDAADYIVWRKTLSQTVSLGSGADGNANGAIDVGDYTYWAARFGNPVLGSGGGQASIVGVPEPAALVIALVHCGLIGFWPLRRHG